MTPARKEAIVMFMETLQVQGRHELGVHRMLRDAMEALEQAENQLAELGRENEDLREQGLRMARDQEKLVTERDKLILELGELQLMAVRTGTVRMGPNASEEAEVRPRRRRR